MLEEHRLKQKQISNPFGHIPESELEIDHQSAYKRKAKPIDLDHDLDGAKVQVSLFQSLDDEKSESSYNRIPQEFRSEEVIKIKPNGKGYLEKIDANHTNQKVSTLADILKDYRNQATNLKTHEK